MRQAYCARYSDSLNDRVQTDHRTRNPLERRCRKTFFTILDFRGACELFKDPDFDGDPDIQTEWGEGDPVPTGGNDKKPVLPPITPPAPKPPRVVPKPGENDGESEEKVVYQVRGVPVEVLGSSVSYLDESGNLVTAKFRDYTRRNILRAFGSEADFMEVWNGTEEKRLFWSVLSTRACFLTNFARNLKTRTQMNLICFARSHLVALR